MKYVNHEIYNNAAFVHRNIIDPINYKLFNNSRDVTLLCKNIQNCCHVKVMILRKKLMRSKILFASRGVFRLS